MTFCISPEELRKALKDIERAEENGFYYCISVFKMTSAGEMLDQCQATYSDMIEKAHPTNGMLDWGRFQGVTRTCKFINGELIPIDNV